MKSELILVALTVVCLSQTAFAETWTCRNFEHEISCDAEACEAAESFTPMDISLSSTQVSICTYSGCWEGKPDVVTQTGPYLVIAASGLPFSTQPASETDVALTLDRSASVATALIGGSYALPLRCKRTGASDPR